MKTLSKMAGGLLVVSMLALGAAGCADDSHRRGVNDTGEVASDSWITTKVKSELAADKLSTLTHVHVKTYEGVVTLSGSAGSQSDIDRAIQDANGVKGVKSVVNNVEVKP
jgi:hyperosmotically inducible periplasmic protein